MEKGCKYIIDLVLHYIFLASTFDITLFYFRESVGRGMFIDLWPHVLAFCGRGWFEVEEETGATNDEMDRKIPAKKGHEEEISDDSSDESSSSDDDDDDFTQFQLDGIHTAIV